MCPSSGKNIGGSYSVGTERLSSHSLIHIPSSEPFRNDTQTSYTSWHEAP